MLFEDVWAVIKESEVKGDLTVEQAFDVATRLPLALFVSMMEALDEAGEDPAIIVRQVERLYVCIVQRLREVENAMTPPAIRKGMRAVSPQNARLN